MQEKSTDFPAYKIEVVSFILPCELFVAFQEMAPGNAYVQEREDINFEWVKFSDAFSEFLS